MTLPGGTGFHGGGLSRRAYNSVVTDEPGWRCPLCGAIATSGAEHLRAQHGIGGWTEDRLGLRKAVQEHGPRAPKPPRRSGVRVEEPPLEPPRPAPLPEEASVLRLLCGSLEGVDLADLQARVTQLAGVESVAVDLYEGTVDLFLDRSRAAAVPHLVALATERVGLVVVAAELHRAPSAGAKLGRDTFLVVVR